MGSWKLSHFSWVAQYALGSLSGRESRRQPPGDRTAGGGPAGSGSHRAVGRRPQSPAGRWLKASASPRVSLPEAARDAAPGFSQSTWHERRPGGSPVPLTTYSQNSHALTSALVYLLPASQWASLGAQTVKNLPAMRRWGFDPWVRKIPWRRAWQPTPVFLPGEPHGQRGRRAAVHGVAESDPTERLFTSLLHFKQVANSSDTSERS